MFFFLSKIIAPLLSPLNALIVLQASGLLLMIARRTRAFGTAVVAACTLVLLVVAATPLSSVLLERLEQTVPKPARLPEKVDGIVLLGGAQNPRLTEVHDEPHMGPTGTMVFAFLALGRRYPEAKLVFSGGTGELNPVAALSEADVMRMVASRQGVDVSRLLIEDKSRNTHENAVFTKELIKPAPGGAWILVAAAAHMPRALAVFEKQGLRMIPYPTAYRTTGDLVWQLEAVGNFDKLNALVHELIGMAVYKVTGRI
jgi:uncharacterized SAM-binding protein YcdF (DUF218 family)